MGERPLRRLTGAWGAPEPIGNDMAPVLLGFPAELALTRSVALFTGALGVGDSCSSCACGTYLAVYGKHIHIWLDLELQAAQTHADHVRTLCNTCTAQACNAPTVSDV